MKKEFSAKANIFHAFLIISLALLSAFMFNFAPTENSPKQLAWYLLTGVTLFIVAEYMLYENFLSERIAWSAFLLVHFVAYLVLGVVFMRQIGYINLRPLFSCLASYSVIIFQILRNFRSTEAVKERQ
jgi:hypothetical protein